MPSWEDALMGPAPAVTTGTTNVSSGTTTAVVLTGGPNTSVSYRQPPVEPTPLTPSGVAEAPDEEARKVKPVATTAHLYLHPQLDYLDQLDIAARAAGLRGHTRSGVVRYALDRLRETTDDEAVVREVNRRDRTAAAGG
jgi:hypothetical protein